MSERDVRTLVGAASFERGHAYLRRGAVHHARRAGAALEARCEGSHGEAYPVRAEFDARGLAGAHCGCPVGEDGRCKHVAAVLLLFARAPALFAWAPAPAEVLAGLDRDELLALVRSLAENADGAAAVLDARLAPPATPREDGSVESFVLRAGEVYRAAGGGPEGARALLDLHRELLERAGDEPGARAAAHAAVGGAALVRRGRGGDEALLALAQRCLAGVGDALAAAQDPAARAGLLRELLDWYRLELQAGSRDVGPRVSAALCAGARPEERTLAAQRVRAWVDRAEPWARRYLAGAWLDLCDGRDAADAEYLALCRAAGRVAEAAVRRWERGGEAEARAELAAAGESELLAAGDALEARAHPLAETVARELERRAGDSPHPRARAWLLARARRRGDPESALRHAAGLLDARPDRESHDALCALGESLGRGGEVRARAREILRARHPALLAELLLDGGETDAAVVVAADDAVRGAAGQRVRLRAASAAEREHPGAAAGLYVLCAEGLIRARGRGNYRAAAGMIARARALATREGEATRARLDALIESLRERYANLPALQDELAHRGAA